MAGSRSGLADSRDLLQSAAAGRKAQLIYSWQAGGESFNLQVDDPRGATTRNQAATRETVGARPEHTEHWLRPLDPWTDERRDAAPVRPRGSCSRRLSPMPAHLMELRAAVLALE